MDASPFIRLTKAPGNGGFLLLESSTRSTTVHRLVLLAHLLGQFYGACVVGETERLSWHSLRHSYASMLATDLELPATTLARLTGHTDAGFTLRVYARDGRDAAAVVEDVLSRAAGAGIGA